MPGSSIGPPGVLLVLLSRDVTSTQVLVRKDAPETPPFLGAPARDDAGQLVLVEELCRTLWANEVSRLYASTLAVELDGERLGLFVGFLDEDANDAPTPPLFEWQDLREAASSLTAPWGPLLADVRQRFIAQSPDEALRVR